MDEQTPNYDIRKRLNIERSIIGCIIVDKSAMKIVVDNRIDDVDYFRDLLCKEVFKICLWLYRKNIPIDLVTILSNRYYTENPKPEIQTNSDNYNTFDYQVVQLSQLVFSSAHLVSWINILKQYIFQDFWNRTSSDILENNWDNRDVGLIDENIIREHDLLKEKLFSNLENGSSKLLSFDEKREKVLRGEFINVPLPTDALNEFISGLVPPELSILAARPGMAKTTVALATAMNASIEKNFKGLFITLEMLSEQLVNRIITNRSSITNKQIREFKFTDEEFRIYKGMYNEITKNPNLIFLDSNEAGDLRGIKKAIEKHKPHYVIIDYIQLIQTDKTTQNREQQIALISRTLKSYCNEFNIPILALSQLSRNVEHRTNKRPMLSDLRESGAIEQDADNVWFLYRDAYYREQQRQFVTEIEKGNLEWLIGKGRGTGLTTFEMWIDLKNLKIENQFKNFQEVSRNFNHTVPPPPNT